MRAQTLKTRQTIRSQAEKLFRERGYAAVGMRDVAKASGIEAASIYNHYSSKDELLKTICFEIGDQFFQALEEVSAAKSPLEGGRGMMDSAVNTLRAAIKAHVSVIANNVEASTVFFHEWMFLE